MTWLLSILVALLTGAFSMFVAGLIASACVSWYRISSFEGGAGYFVVFMALLGGLAGLVIGLVASRLVAAGASPGFLKSLGFSWAVVGGIGGIATWLCWVLADVPPRIGGQELLLEVELRLPAGETNSPASFKESNLGLGSVVNRRQRSHEWGELHLADARLVDGRWVIPGSVFLYTMRGGRVVDFTLDGRPTEGFLVPLPARPGTQFEQWSDWLPRNKPGSPRWPDTKVSYRFRVQRIQPAPAPRDPAEVEAEQFSTLKPDAPLDDWLSFLSYDSTEPRVRAVMSVVESRPEELVRLIGSTNSTARERALGAVPRLTAITPEISEAVLAEGREIADAIRAFNAMPAEDPSFLDVQVELRSRFNFWKRAWWATQQRLGLDGRPPVQEIHDLALVRARETTMDEIVANASAILSALDPAGTKSP